MMQSDKTDQNEERIFDSSVFTDYLKSKLIGLFDLVEGKKQLVTEPSIINLLNMILGKQLLEENGVKKIQTLEEAVVKGVDKEFVHVLFFIQPTLKAIHQISEIINKEMSTKKKNQKQEIEYVIIYWPQRSILCDEALERLGIKGCVEIQDFNFDLIPLDEDIISYQMNNSFSDLYLKKDLSIYKYIAESIQKIQTVYGKIPNIFAKGDGAKVILEILEQEVDISQEINGQQQPEIETMIIMDRSIDLLTPMCYQMIYEAQLDEKFDINCNFAFIDTPILTPGQGQGTKTKLQLNGKATPLYKDLRNMHLNRANLYLRERYQQRKIAEEEVKKMKLEKKTIEEMAAVAQMVKDIQTKNGGIEYHFSLIQYIFEKLNGPQCLTYNKEKDFQVSALLKSSDDLCKSIYDYLDMQCALGVPIENVLRLLILICQIEGGIKTKEYEKIRRSLVNAYGFDKIIMLDNLAECGLLRKQDNNRSQFEKIKDKFKLLYPEVDVDKQDDVSYVYEGYSPITVRLAESAIANQSWKEYKEYIGLIPGETKAPEKYVRTTKDKPCIMIFMIGGVTYSEIAAFRYLGWKYQKEIVICTTQILDYKKLYQQIYQYQQDTTLIQIKENTIDIKIESIPQKKGKK